CEGRYGIAPGEDARAAQEAFESAVAAAAQSEGFLRDHPPAVEWWGGQFLPAQTADDAAIVGVASAAIADVTGQPARVEGMTYGADMRLLVNEGGIPTVLYGAGDVRRAHRPDECVPIDELLIVARTLVVSAM